MFNKSVTPESEKRQAEMFEMLIDVFTPGAKIHAIESKSRFCQWECTENERYRVTSMLERQECTVKEGNKVIFEIYLDEDYLFATRGKFLKHLLLDEPLLKKIESVGAYHERYDMKHLFVVDRDEAVEICKAYMTRAEWHDNGLVKPGEIEDSRKPE